MIPSATTTPCRRAASATASVVGLGTVTACSIEQQVCLAHRRGRQDEREVRVVRDHRLGEDDELGALGRGLRDRGTDLLRRPVAAEEDGAQLDGRGPDAVRVSWSAGRSERPGVEDERVVALVEQEDVEHVERADGPDPWNERRLAVAVERLEREPARVDLAALGHEGADLLVDDEVPGERLGRELRKAPLDAEQHARPIQEDARLEPLPHQARGLQHVHEADRPLERHGMEGDERLLSGLGLHVFEYLLLVVDEEIAFLVLGQCDGGHGSLLRVVRVRGRVRARSRALNALERGARALSKARTRGGDPLGSRATFPDDCGSHRFVSGPCRPIRASRFAAP